jgi:voltage-gated potassium channel
MTEPAIHRGHDTLHEHRFTVLMIVLLSLFVIVPVFQTSPFALESFELVFSAIMAVAIYANSQKRGHLIAGLILGVPALTGRWLPLYTHNAAYFAAVTALSIVFFLYAATLILVQVARATRITTDALSAALCVYLLVGIAWSALYSLIYLFDPSAFAMPPLRASEYQGIAPIRAELFRLLYFSFTTLTTMGYGDITPMAPAARGLAVLEAILGQFYVAVVVARLVSLQVIHATRGGGGPG